MIARSRSFHHRVAQLLFHCTVSVSYVMLIMLSHDCTFAFSDTLLQHIATFVGETVHLQCGENKPSNDRVDWLYLSSPTAKAYHIISAGYLTNGNRGDRLSISGSTLVINNVENKDGGSYICVEDAGRGKKHSVFLTVKGKFRILKLGKTMKTHGVYFLFNFL